MRNKLLILIFAVISSLAANAFTTTPSESLHVWFDDFTINADGKTVAYLKVYENDNIDYTAFNMTFTIPKGLKINRVKQGRETVNDIQLSERAASTHSISCNILEDGVTLRVIATSSQNDNLFPDDEDGKPVDLLYTIGLVASDEMATGTYPIEMSGIKFVIANGDACIPVPNLVKGEVTVIGKVVGVEEIAADKITGPCYDIQGRLVKNPAQGTIVICDGKKYLVK